MNKKTLLIIVMIVFAAFSYRTAFALFSDQATSTNNVFSAAQVFPTATPSASPTPTPDLTGIANHVVISEVQITGGTANADQDFIELYNPTGSSVDLRLWKLTKHLSTGSTGSIITFGSGALIPAHGFFSWSSNKGDNVLPTDVDNTNIIATDNSVALFNPSDVIVDQIAWGSGTSPQFVEGSVFPTNPAANQSIERKALSSSTQATMEGGIDALKGNGFDAGNNATDFILRTVSQPQNSSSAIETP